MIKTIRPTHRGTHTRRPEQYFARPSQRPGHAIVKNSSMLTPSVRIQKALNERHQPAALSSTDSYMNVGGFAEQKARWSPIPYLVRWYSKVRGKSRSVLKMMVTDDFLLLKILTIYAIGLSSAKFQHSEDKGRKIYIADFPQKARIAETEFTSAASEGRQGNTNCSFLLINIMSIPLP